MAHQPNILSDRDLAKLHLQFKHGTLTQIANYLKSAGLWDRSLKSRITTIINSCKCQLASPPAPHAVIGLEPPPNEPQSHLSIDIIQLSGINFLHSLDRATGWSEIGRLSRRDLRIQIDTFRHIQLNRHGVPQTIMADKEYNKELFLDFCRQEGIAFISTAANAHEANGAIERANRSLRSHYDRLRAYNQRASTSELAHEAVFGKILIVVIVSLLHLNFSTIDRREFSAVNNHQQLPFHQSTKTTNTSVALASTQLYGHRHEAPHPFPSTTLFTSGATALVGLDRLE